MKKHAPKILSIALSAVLAVGMVPAVAMADEAGTGSDMGTGSGSSTGIQVAKPKAWEFKVAKRIAAVNYNGSITKAAYPISVIKTGDGKVVESIAKDGTHTPGEAANALGGEGNITYEKVSGSQYLDVTKSSKNSGKYTGKVTVSPKTPVGKHSIVVCIIVGADAKHLRTTLETTVTVEVKRFTPTITVTGKVSPNKLFNPVTNQEVLMIKSVQCAAKPLAYSLVKATDQDGKDATKYFAVDPSTSLTTIAAGTPRGTYKIMYKIRSPKVDGYNANWRTCTGTFSIV